MKKELKTGYESFLGKKVLVSETTNTMKRGEKEFNYTVYKIADDDTVIKDLITQAGKNTPVRVWLPNTVGTMDARPNRLNVKVEKQNDGTYEITKIYFG